MEVGHSPVVLEFGVVFDAVEGGVPEVVDVDVVDEFVACEFECGGEVVAGVGVGVGCGVLVDEFVEDRVGSVGSDAVAAKHSDRDCDVDLVCGAHGCIDDGAVVFGEGEVMGDASC